jgi:Planctomycete cytochrome C
MDTARDVAMDQRPPEVGGGDAPAGTATFTQIYTEILGPMPLIAASSCAGATCHSPGKSGMVDLSTQMMAYRTLVPAKVKAGNTATSSLWTHITSTNATMQMPRGKPPLPAATIAKVTAWINAGAKND